MTELRTSPCTEQSCAQSLHSDGDAGVLPEHAMPDYLFCFGYEAPDDMQWNQKTGSDFESSTGVFIDAPDQDSATVWGVEIAEAFVKHIFNSDSISWKELGYAHWIEDNPEESDWNHCLAFFPRVQIGVLPTLADMTNEAYDEYQRRKAQPSDAGRDGI